MRNHSGDRTVSWMCYWIHETVDIIKLHMPKHTQTWTEIKLEKSEQDCGLYPCQYLVVVFVLELYTMLLLGKTWVKGNMGSLIISYDWLHVNPQVYQNKKVN